MLKSHEAKIKISDMSREEAKAYFEEIERKDARFWEVWKEGTGQIIPSSECEAGYLYWGGGRSIGDVAICVGVEQEIFPGAVMFRGLRNKLGVDYLWDELHYDDNPNFGTWCPLVKLEKVPRLMGEIATMDWLLKQEIYVVEDRIQWLHAMPTRLKESPSFSLVVGEEVTNLGYLREIQEKGFSNTQLPTFKQIMVSKKTE